MRPSAATKAKWLLLSDRHVRHKGLNRVEKTAQWIAAEAERNEVNRVVVCHDFPKNRDMQPADIPTAWCRLIGILSEAVPSVHILLDERDLAYRQNYHATALDASSTRRVMFYKDIAQYIWDGRRVLTLPFRQDQRELTRAAAGIPTSEAIRIVAFGQLAIDKAILQRRLVSAGCKSSDRSTVANPGITGPHEFASLAHTFTGHFRRHQTIAQNTNGSDNTNLQGCITYIGAPIQLSRSDLYGDQRGVLLLDSDSLQHRLLVNPHAVGYKSVDIEHVLDKQIDGNFVTGKHVTLTGSINPSIYATARGKIILLGARRVQKMAPVVLHARGDVHSFGGPGKPVPESDVAIQPPGNSSRGTGAASVGDSTPAREDVTNPPLPQLDIEAELTGYIKSLDLDSSLVSKRDELIRAGQEILQVSRGIVETAGQSNGAKGVTQSSQVFVAEPCTLTITNFLSVNGTVRVNFQRHIPRGITFIAGNNGSGKSTILEAMVWCQFGKCIRDGMYVRDVVNDIAGKDCSVELKFSNGYTILRFRNHRIYKNRVIVKLNGKPLHGFEHPRSSTSQNAIHKLLGIDYDTFVKTVVLSQDGSASFFRSTPAQRRDLIETSLGLSMLDQCEKASNSLLKDTDTDLSDAKVRLEGLVRTKGEKEERLKTHKQAYSRPSSEADRATSSLAMPGRATKAKAYRDRVKYQFEILAIWHHIKAERDTLQQIECSHAQMNDQGLTKPESWLGRILMALTSLLRTLFEACGVSSKSLQDRESDQEAAVNHLLGGIKASQDRLKQLVHKEKTESAHAIDASAKLAQATRIQSEFEATQQVAANKRREAESYKDLAAEENLCIQFLQLEHDNMALKLQELSGRREVFAFWSSALAHRSSPASSQLSFDPTEKKETINFREYIRRSSLKKLNVLLQDILEVLYGNKRHDYLVTGMLRLLFDTVSKDAVDGGLSSRLAAHLSSAYSKRSSGERKRVDIALFFALLLLERRRSAHSTRYVLVDEAFDNLDCAGQAAVIKWFRAKFRMAPPWVIVVTNSRFFIEQVATEDGSNAQVIKANMGHVGTELYVNDCRIRID